MNVLPSPGVFDISNTSETFSKYSNMSVRVNNLSSSIGTVVMPRKAPDGAIDIAASGSILTQ